MDPKNPAVSSTNIVNFIFALLAAALLSAEVRALIPPDYLPIIVALQSIFNIFNRTFRTAAPTTWNLQGR